jgi:uncharacterized protein
MSNNSEVFFNYPLLVDEAMRDVVRQVLKQAAREGLDGKHHFYISFNTQYSGVKISPQLREQYPEEMTIVVQHQYWDLEIQQSYFSVMLSFNNIPEKLVIPFDALTAFADPSMRFGLQFHAKPDTIDVARELLREDADTTSFEDETTVTTKESGGEKVISLDSFRKN